MKGSCSIAKASVFDKSGLKLAVWNLDSGLGVNKLSPGLDDGEREAPVVSRLA